MTWSNTLELALQKFNKLTTKYGQILSYARQGPDLEFLFNFLCLELYCHHLQRLIVLHEKNFYF
jgi:hypothetical protein